MRRRREDEILKSLVERKLVHPQGLALLEKMIARYGVRLGSLIGTGRLDAEVLKELEAELDAQESVHQTAPGSDAATTADAPAPEVTTRLPSRAETVPRPADAIPEAGRWAGRRIGHYELGAILGAGGMGEVYHAYDEKLKRDVAIKLLQSDDPKLQGRFLQEARLQARVEHPGVCKVHETGEADGRPFIVMQLIQGDTLTQWHQGIALMEKLKVMIDVCEAVQEAHKLGLIHRDLKPGNIMVEKAQDGGWRPYVLDFGLARDIDGPGTTTTGQPIGTPCYMAPEQAQGRKDQMGPRTDVYGLGATLHFLVAGRPPFEAEGGVDLLMKVVQQEPKSPRSMGHKIPLDLDTVLMKCLEKEPARRYGSASEVAEELRRVVQGEPIQARRAGLTVRLRKKAWKHRTVVAVSALAVAALLVAGGINVQQRWKAAERARLAQQFGQEIERIDTMMRTAALQPLHSIGPEKQHVRQAMGRIEEQMKSIGAVAEAPGNFALGRGYLALQEDERAREYLERAWDGGYRAPEVAYALGIVIGNLYRRELSLLENIRSTDLREARRKEIERDFRDPAMRYLQESRGAYMSSPEYAEGLLAYYEKNYPVAIEKAGKAYQRGSWFYEAKILEADVRIAMGNDLFHEGDVEGQLAALHDAETALQAATGTGQSDPRAYQSTCDLWLGLMFRAVYGTGEDIALYRRNAVLAGEHALVADAQSPETYARLSAIHRLSAEYAIRHGDDPSDWLAKATSAAGKLTALRSRDSASWYLAATVDWVRSRYEAQTGDDPLESLDRAARNYRRALTIKPDSATALNGLGVALWYQGQYESSHGRDAVGSLTGAIDCFRKSIQGNPQYHFAYSNLLGALNDRGLYEMQHGLDPQPALKEAAAVSAQSLKLNAKMPDLFNNSGTTSLYAATFEVSRGRDPGDAANNALRFFHEALTLDPQLAAAIVNSADALRLVAEYQMKSGTNPAKPIGDARGWLRTDVARKTFPSETNQVMARLSLIEAEHMIATARSPLAALKDARASLEKAADSDPEAALTYQLHGLADILEARWHIHKKQRPDDSLASARAALTRSSQLGPHDSESFRLLAEVELLATQYGIKDPTVVATGIKRGLELAAKSLTLNPANADALATAAQLHLREARQLADQASKREAAQKAREEIRRALDLNPLLRSANEALLAKAEELLR
ncbi:MAG: protein kinase [Acidobacteria bacterium]|nr:protein kinase [Acidobacteriota bacterium]